MEDVEVKSMDRSFGKIKNSKTGMLLRAIVGTSLLSIVIFRVDFQTALDIFTRTNLYYFSLVLLILFADRFLMAFKWNLLIQIKGIGLSIYQSLKIYLISNFFGIFLPTGIGGDIYRIYYASKRKGQTEDIAASVVLERFMGIISSAIFAVFGIILMIGLNSRIIFGHRMVVIVFGMLILSVAAFWVSIQRGIVNRFESVLKKRGDNRFFNKLLQCQRAYIEFGQHKRVLLVFLFLSVIEQSLFAIANYWGARAMNLDIGFIYFIGIIPICQILMRIPISINAIGVQEGLYTFFFSRLGVSVTEAFSLALLVRIAHWLIVLPGAILYLSDSVRSKRHREILQGSSYT